MKHRFTNHQRYSETLGVITTWNVWFDNVDAGYLTCIQKERDGIIVVEELFIAPTHRGYGLSHQLMKRCIKRFKNDTMKLYVRPFAPYGADTSDLIRFYGKYGFRRVNKTYWMYRK